MLLADRDVEIVADRGFEGRVRPEEWHDVCAAIEREFRDDRWHEGALLAVDGVTALAVREFPRTGRAGRERATQPPADLVTARVASPAPECGRLSGVVA